MTAGGDAREGAWVYFDASPLVALARIGRLDLLELLPTPIQVSTLVWREVAGEPARPGAGALIVAREAGLIAVVEEGEPADFPQLDPGEASTLSAGRKAGALVIIDDRPAQRLMERDASLSHVRRLGTVGLLLLAKRRGLIEQVWPLLDALRRESFRIRPTVYQEALREAGEWPPRTTKT